MPGEILAMVNVDILIIRSIVVASLVAVPISASGSAFDSFVELRNALFAGYETAGEWSLENYVMCFFPVPVPVAVAPEGDVYVAEGCRGRLQRYGREGRLKGEWVLVKESKRGELTLVSSPFRISDLAVAGDGTLYVAAGYGGCEVQRYDPEGKQLGEWGGPGSGPGRFESLSGVAVAPNGHVYVADTGNNRIQYFTAAGSFLGEWGGIGGGDGKFRNPRGIAVAADGAVYVADTGNKRIQYFTLSGSFLGKWGSDGTGPGRFEEPIMVAVAPDGRVFVSDLRKRAVEIYSRSGVFKGALLCTPNKGNGYYYRAVAVAPDGFVYVTDGEDFYVNYFKPVKKSGFVIPIFVFFVAGIVVAIVYLLYATRRMKRVSA